jgi:hypothetical protein
MALVGIPVAELAEQLKIQDSTIAYNELQFGFQRNKRYTKDIERVRLGLQTSPENFFYDETAFAGAPYVYLKSLEFTMLAGTAAAGVYENVNIPGVELWKALSCGMSLAAKSLPVLWSLALRPASLP